MPGAAARDTAGNDLAALAHEASQATHVLVVDQVDLVGAELTDLPPAEPAALDGLLGCRGNGSLLPLLLVSRTGHRRCRSRRPRQMARPTPLRSPGRRHGRDP